MYARHFDTSRDNCASAYAVIAPEAPFSPQIFDECDSHCAHCDEGGRCCKMSLECAGLFMNLGFRDVWYPHVIIMIAGDHAALRLAPQYHTWTDSTLRHPCTGLRSTVQCCSRKSHE